MVTVAGRPGRTRADPLATATFLPSASNTSGVPIATVRPRWVTVPCATRSWPFGATGRRKLTLKSTEANAVPAVIVAGSGSPKRLERARGVPAADAAEMAIPTRGARDEAAARDI